ncbi:MAG: hypothetical protein ACKOVB_17930 [Terrabacter sp.]
MQARRRVARWGSGALALVGVGLLAPSFSGPTRTISVSDRERGALLRSQYEWRWGRFRLTGVENVELQDTWSWVGLVVFVLLAAAASVCVVLWLLDRRLGSAAGPAAVGLLAGSVLTTMGSRLDKSLTEVDQGVAGLTVNTRMTLAGSLETVSAVVLVGAVVAMVLIAVRDRAGGAPGPGERPASPAPGRVAGTGPTRGTGDLRPAGEHLSSPEVGLVDDGPSVGGRD